MSDQTSIFNSQETPENKQDGGNAAVDSQALNALNTLLASIKNENGEQKYKTVEEALKGLGHAQEHIRTLTTEKRQYELEAEGLRPVLDQVKELRQVVERLTQTNTDPNTKPVEVKGLTEEQVARMVEAQLSKTEQDRVAKQNLGSVVELVTKKFGEKAEEVFYQRAKELGMSQAEINAFAARTPKAALKMLGIDEVPTKGVTTAPTGGVNTTEFNPNPQTFIGRNTRKLEIGATARELAAEAEAARKMVDELAVKGMSITDLTNPSVYFKHFN